ncbi:MAG: hypothetical protein D6769_03655 [Methanobacteriota archaeon]|nr:MAG: hypothetical protein D6769_03655 [Euryarchaeota archaeon]
MNQAKLFVVNVLKEVIKFNSFLAFILEILYALFNIQISLPVTPDSTINIPIAIGQLQKPLIDMVSLLATFLTAGIAEWGTKLFVVCFSNAYALTLFFPLGIVFRSIKVTEGFGNSLIALSISFSIVYPILLTANGAIYALLVDHKGNIRSGISRDLIDAGSSVLTASYTLLAVSLGLSGASALTGGLSKKYPGFGSVLNHLKNIPGANFIASSSKVLSNMTGLLKPLLIIDIMFSLFIPFLLNFLEWAALVMGIFGLFLTIINIYVTMSFAYEFSKLLRTPLELSALMRFL